jgi:hypothetical protein
VPRNADRIYEHLMESEQYRVWPARGLVLCHASTALEYSSSDPSDSAGPRIFNALMGFQPVRPRAARDSSSTSGYFCLAVHIGHFERLGLPAGV